MDVDDILEQTQWDFSWVPQDARVADRPELLYVSCPRDVPTLNAVTRLRAKPGELPGIVDEVQKAHAGVRSRFMLVPRTRSDAVLRALEAGGYVPGAVHVASVIDVGDYDRAAPSGIVVHTVDDLARLRDCRRMAAVAFGEPGALSERDEAHELAACTGPTARVHRVVAYDANSGEPLASAGLSVFAPLSFGLLWGGGTVPHARGRGAYTALVRARVELARRVGLRRVGLYARVDTSAPIVKRQGFRSYGEMAFWQRGASE